MGLWLAALDLSLERVIDGFMDRNASLIKHYVIFS